MTVDMFCGSMKSGVADTSREAYRNAAGAMTAGQQRVLSAFGPGVQLTRQEIADRTGMLLQTVCGRVNELVATGELEELPARNGAHPLRLHVRVERPRCMCERCSPAAPGETYTEAYRHACEARYVAGMASHEQRAGYLAGVAKHRGLDAAQRLRAASWELMREEEAMA